MKNKIFISHASEDKSSVALPLACLLQAEGFDVWYDEFSLTVGDSLIKSIDLGLANCDYAVVILSKHFFRKKWTARELAGLSTRELHSPEKIILPVWHNIEMNEVMAESAPLADKLALNSSIGFEALVEGIKKAVLQKHPASLPTQDDKSIVYVSGNDRYILIDEAGKLANVKITNWLYVTDKNITELRQGGIGGSGAISNIASNLGVSEVIKEGGTLVTYTALENSLVPFKLYEHTITFQAIDCFTNSNESVATNLLTTFERHGTYVFFPRGRKPKTTHASILLNGSLTQLEPILSSDRTYLQLGLRHPPNASRVILQWEW